MLSISSMTPGQEHYYLELAREDYYFQGGEPPGYWRGFAADRLGLTGVVQRGDLQALLEGRSPDGPGLVQPHARRQPGWDLTFSAPKSVSVLWAVADRELRAEVEDAHRHAVDQALGYLESNAACSRRGKGGERLESVEIACALFPHQTSRALDPQLHTHVLVPNVGRRFDGTWGALRSYDLYMHKMAAGALYRAALGERLCHGVGLTLERGKHSFEVKGVPEALRADLSSRRQLIEEILAARGWSGAKAAAAVAESSRDVKHHVARETLFPHWRATAERFGFTMDAAAQLVGRSKRPRSESADMALIEATTAQVFADLTTYESYVRERDVLAPVARALEHQAISAERLEKGVRQYLETCQEVVRLGEVYDYKCYTSQELYESEKRLLEAAEQSRDATNHVLSQDTIISFLEQKVASEGGRAARHELLSDEQCKALIHITHRPGLIQCVQGYAGTGKSTMLDAARELWEKNGYNVIGCAPSGVAARNLEQASDIRSSTLHRLLYDADKPFGDEMKHHARMLARAAQKQSTWTYKYQPIDSKSVIVIDEAAMVGTRMLERLVTIAVRVGAKIVMVGDTQQLQSVEAGGGFRALMDRLGCAWITDIRRQYEDWMRDAVKQIAEGDVRGGLHQFWLAEKLHAPETKQEAVDALIKSWLEKRTSDLSDTLILTGTREDAARLNKEAQMARMNAGEVSLIHSAKGKDCLFGTNDRVMFTKNRRSAGYLNGDFGTIEKITDMGRGQPKQLTIRLDNDHKFWFFSAPRRVTISLTPDAPLTLGYAATTHKAQGATVGKIFVLASGPMLDGSLIYVQVSRCREDVQIFLVKGEAEEDLQEMLRMLEREKEKQRLAHDVAQAQGIHR